MISRYNQYSVVLPIETIISILLFLQSCLCHKDNRPADWKVLSQRTARLGGCIGITLFCSGCATSFEFMSDASNHLKERIVASSLAAGISHGKYRRFGTALGKIMTNSWFESYFQHCGDNRRFLVFFVIEGVIFSYGWITESVLE